MNLTGKEMNKKSNVLSLFGTMEQDTGPDPLQELLKEAEAEAWETEDEAPVKRADRILVSAHQFPDQSMYTLDKQLALLTESMARLKFYVSDLDDLLPR